MSKRAIFGKKNILVTGGAGFIGSHLCDELIKTCKVICIDNFSTGDERNIDHLLMNENFEFIRHNIVEPIILEDLPELQKFKIQFQGIQEIYHLACPMSPKNFEQNKIATLLANSYGMKNALDLAIKHQAKFMHFSSSVVYGPRRESKNGAIQIKEEDIGKVNILSARACYDEGKRFAETMVKDFGDVYNIDTKIIRVFRTYGPRMRLNDDQMIPDFINNALDNKNLVVLGNESFTSSLCYVNDCIDAAIKMMDTDLPGPLNIGSDVEINLTDLAQQIIKALKSKSNIVYDEEKLFMTPLCLPDITQAKNKLAWMPVVTLKQGLEKTIDDLRANKGLKGI
ncbi:MAG: NAD-dependent epimerase/dehydratase family protein [Patescibacteria group bacterium]|nr:NAD-dependent epimerase/dehydratase family protein [Patescibacteria group bacterium]MBU1160559.1 NAD-dependent epimerase/dehydratase family protein [Patescibacteria group bacterium]MBU1349977.1 NAD-dependent epimerase/dehydratase family protein [Patescibacteria group bacterium]MBU1421453.1 NAD-dependent epimerase/dehydratase family protein [Patescibacteria group bacterium]MBU1683909.1 NAD-dependent epimerase/dehydratase family protein [Patescibacteria group bacterium]